jgi:uncharacterized membrane protein
MHYVFLALLFALLIGIVAGLRAMTPLAVLAWGTLLGWLNLDGTWAAWIGSIIAVVIFSILAVGELITDQLPKTPSRKSTPQFATRLVIGGLAGAIIGTPFGHIYSAIGAGIIGAVLGTLGGYEARKRLVAADGGHDLPIALLEDAVAVLGGFVIVYAAGLV